MRAVGAEGGAVFPENNSDGEQCWGESPVWELRMGTSLHAWKSGSAFGSFPLAENPFTSGSFSHPRTLLRFQKKKGVWSSAAPPSSPLEATSESSAKSLSHTLGLRPDVLSSLSLHLHAGSPGTSPSLVPPSGRSSSHPRAEKSDSKTQPASTDWTDWLSQGRNQGVIAEGHTSWCFGEWVFSSSYLISEW